KEARIAPHFYLIRHRTQLELYETNLRFDLVYFDAFSPAVQPTLWQKEIFDRLFSIMAPGSLLVTYAAKGQVRRNMQEAGFRTERLPGAPGKREMLRARKI
ncbi:MAG TPA: MnmC family methyltransferase, partial [Bacteroidales bacterium]|nr:MnmC family methyltransferase [Bacteroidales bacterium]